MRIFCTLFAFVAMFAFQAEAYVAEQKMVVSGFASETFTQNTPQEFIALTPSDVASIVGKDLTFGQTKSLKAAQKMVKRQMRKSQGSNAPASDDDQVLLIVLAIFLPPLAIYLLYDEIGKDFWINFVLTICTGIGGVIHALIHVLRD